MAFFNVKITLTQESIFDVEIEAADCEDAELVAKTAVWEDDYTDDIRNTLEITDEAYDAEEVIETHFCPICENIHDHGTQAAINVQAFVDSDKVIHTP